MPELPEVEVARTSIKPFIQGNTVSSVSIYTPDLRWPVSQSLATQLVGQTIQSVARRGKYLLLQCQTGAVLVHLGMTGFLRILPVGTPLDKHDHYDLTFQDGVMLRFNDVRRFGAILWTDAEPSLHKLLANLGPEPLSENFDGKYLHKKSRNRKISIKQFIMDPSIVGGVGNIYANEALFHASIRPTTVAGRVSLSRNKRLVTAIKTVLTTAIEVGGTMLDFRDGIEKQGCFHQHLAVYKRVGEPCPVCATLIQMKRLGPRSVYFCKVCQR